MTWKCTSAQECVLICFMIPWSTGAVQRIIDPVFCGFFGKPSLATLCVNGTLLRSTDQAPSVSWKYVVLRSNATNLLEMSFA